MAKRRYQISIEEKVMEDFDKAADASYMNRSQLLQLLMQHTSGVITDESVMSVAQSFADASGKTLSAPVSKRKKAVK